MAYAPGKGTTITVATAAVAQVVNVTPPAMEMGITETTHLTSTWREYIANIPDGGDVTFTVEYDSAAATHATLWSTFTGAVAVAWTVVFTDTGATVISFSGLMKTFSWDEVVVDNVVTAQFTVKVTGAVTITP